MALEVGSLIYNRYRIENILAQGGMGAIYRAKDESLGVIVALKENLFLSDDSSRQFHREATILAGLRHPYLPRVTDHFNIAGQGQYLVMDFIEGNDLKEWIASKGVIDEEEAVLIATAVCDGLIYLHGLTPPIVHRDIKPGNIKITPTGQVYLVDFGLAKVAQKGENTEVGAQALTPGYAPPEQYGKGTDPRSDVYSMGATLYAALTGKVPEDSLARAMGSVKLTPIHVHNPNVSQRLESVINKSMQVIPDNRFQTIADLKNALLSSNASAFKKSTQMTEIRVSPTSEFQLQTPTTSMPSSGPRSQHPSLHPSQYSAQPPPTYPSQYSAQVSGYQQGQPSVSAGTGSQTSRRIAGMRVSYWMAGLLVVGTLIVGAGILAGLFYFGGGFERFQSTTAVQVEQIETTPESVAGQLTESATAVESGGDAAILTPEPSMTPEPSLTPTEAFTPTPATTSVGGGGAITFASNRGDDGRFQLWQMQADGSGLEQLTFVQDGACQPDWAPDGSRLVFVSPCSKRQEDYAGSGLYLMDADGSNIVPLVMRPGGDFDPDFSPDGTKIAFTSVRDNFPHIYVFNLNDNSEVSYSSISSHDRRPAWSPDGTLLAFETTRGGSSQIWYLPLDNSDKPRELSYFQDPAYRPVWAPDGITVYYSQGDSQPWITSKKYDQISAPEAQEIGVAAGTGGDIDARPAWDVDVSPDGIWLVFEGWGYGNNRDILIMMSNGGSLTRLTDDEFVDMNPVWKP
jgi:eukaryotic-like serine/threonine-protein kinase